jgi:hypothetical protein
MLSTIYPLKRNPSLPLFLPANSTPIPPLVDLHFQVDWLTTLVRAALLPWLLIRSVLNRMPLSYHCISPAICCFPGSLAEDSVWCSSVKPSALGPVFHKAVKTLASSS